MFVRGIMIIVQTFTASRAINFRNIRKAEIFAKINQLKKLVPPLYAMRRKANAKIYRREMTFHEQNTKINSRKNK